jgi:mannose-6-phosphate isomerase
VLESEERPWGPWHVIDVKPGYKIERIHVPPRRLSYQVHDHRSEDWVVVFERATCTIDG